MREKINTAIEFMKDGKSFRVGDLRLGMNEFYEIEVSGWSNYLNLENIDKTVALNELTGIKSQFLFMIKNSSELATFIEEKVIEFILFYDDSGKGSLQLVSEKNGIIKWSSVLK